MAESQNFTRELVNEPGNRMTPTMLAERARQMVKELALPELTVEVYGLGLDYPWRYPELIQHLTPADIQAVADKYIHPENYLLVIVGKKSAMTSLPGASPSQKKEEKKEEKVSESEAAAGLAGLFG